MANVAGLEVITTAIARVTLIATAKTTTAAEWTTTASLRWTLGRRATTIVSAGKALAGLAWASTTMTACVAAASAARWAAS